ERCRRASPPHDRGTPPFSSSGFFRLPTSAACARSSSRGWAETGDNGKPANSTLRQANVDATTRTLAVLTATRIPIRSSAPTAHGLSASAHHFCSEFRVSVADVTGRTPSDDVPRAVDEDQHSLFRCEDLSRRHRSDYFDALIDSPCGIEDGCLRRPATNSLPDLSEKGHGTDER